MHFGNWSVIFASVVLGGVMGREVMAQTRFIIVRHAEKDLSQPQVDPPLSQAGEQRAERLAEMLVSAGVKACYASRYKRTQQTAAPLAKRLEQTVIPYDPVRPKLLIELMKKHPNETVLVVGHSNTIPNLLSDLGIAIEAIEETDYGNLFLVDADPDGQREAKLLHLHY